jgi:hypothetical protein
MVKRVTLIERAKSSDTGKAVSESYSLTALLELLNLDSD